MLLRKPVNSLSVLALLTFVFASFAHAGETRPNSYAVGYAGQSSARYSGNVMQAGVETSTSENTRLGFSALRLYREYSADARVIDSSFGVSAAHSYGQGRYFESRIESSPDGEILPKWTFAIAPHKVIGTTDFGLGFDYRVYQAVSAGTLHPNVRHEFSDRFAISAGSFIARSDSTLISYHGDIAFKPVMSQTVKLSGATGRTLEDAGLSAGFSSVYASYSVGFGRFNVGVDANRYWSDLRTETSLGLKVEFR